MSSELSDRLQEQVELLRHDAQSFDDGFVLAYFNMATRLRTLVHDTATSHSVMQQVGVKKSLHWIDGSDRPEPNARVLWSGGLAAMRLETGGQGHNTVGFVALQRQDLLDGGRWTTFEDWWNRRHIVDATEFAFSRKMIVIAVANKAGGAHLDRRGAPAWFATMNTSIGGWTYSTDGGPEQPLDESPIPANVRTIAEEFLTSLHVQEANVSAALAASGRAARPGSIA